MKEKLKLIVSKYPRTSLVIGIILGYFIFESLYNNLDNLGAFIALVLFLAVPLTYLAIMTIFRYINPWIEKYPRAFIFSLIALPCFLVFIYGMFVDDTVFPIHRLNLIYKFALYITLLVGILSLYSIYDIKGRKNISSQKNKNELNIHNETTNTNITFINEHYIETLNQDKYARKNDDLKSTLDDDIRKVEEKEADFSIFLKDPSLWNKIINHEKGKLFFNKEGRVLDKEILPMIKDLSNVIEINDNTLRQIENKEVVASLCRTLWNNQLFKEEYNKWEHIIKMAKGFFGTATTYTKDKSNVIPNLFTWILNL